MAPVRAAAALLLSGAAFAVGVLVIDPAPVARALTPAGRPAQADAALAFSGDPGYSRTLEAVRLYRRGYVRYLLFSGAGGPGDSGLSMAAVAEQHGVPVHHILLEQRATNTYENVLFIRPLLEGHRVRRLILVTSPYHQLRAYLVARHLLPHMVLINDPVQDPGWNPEVWWRDPDTRAVVVQEYTKLAGYLVMGRL